MNKLLKYRDVPFRACLIIGISLFIFSSCREDRTARTPKDVSRQPKYSKGLTVDAEYQLMSDAFFRVYEGKNSLHGPNSVWCNFSVADFRSGGVHDKYVKGVVLKDTRIKYERAIVNDLETHTVILYYALIQSGDYKGSEVLINDLVGDVHSWLKPVASTPMSSQENGK